MGAVPPPPVATAVSHGHYFPTLAAQRVQLFRQRVRVNGACRVVSHFYQVILKFSHALNLLPGRSRPTRGGAAARSVAGYLEAVGRKISPQLLIGQALLGLQQLAERLLIAQLRGG